MFSSRAEPVTPHPATLPAPRAPSKRCFAPHRHRPSGGGSDHSASSATLWRCRGGRCRWRCPTPKPSRARSRERRRPPPSRAGGAGGAEAGSAREPGGKQQPIGGRRGRVAGIVGQSARGEARGGSRLICGDRSLRGVAASFASTLLGPSSLLLPFPLLPLPLRGQRGCSLSLLPSSPWPCRCDRSARRR